LNGYKTRQEMEADEGRLLAPFAQSQANRGAGNFPSRVTPIAPNFNVIAPASFIRALFAAWNTRRRFFSTAPGTICARDLTHTIEVASISRTIARPCA